MRVLALDPGHTTGWAAYDIAGDMADCGEADLRDLCDIGAKAAELASFLRGHIRLYAPDLIAVERPFGTAKFTANDVVILCGIVHMVAHEHGLPRREFTASALKKAITGSGKASKAEVMAAVPRFGFFPGSDHAADAAACAIAAASRETQREAPKRAPKLTLACPAEGLR